MMSTPISDRSVVAAVKNQVSCDLAPEVVILNMADSVYYGLNAVGARIWALLQEPRAVEEIRQVLLDEYDIDAQTCETQLSKLLHDLAVRGLIEVQA